MTTSTSMKIWLFLFTDTVMAIGNEIKRLSFNKFTLFKTSWQMFRVLPQLSHLGLYLPLLRAFQWGTAWPFSIRGIKNTTCQSWNIKHNLQSRNWINIPLLHKPYVNEVTLRWKKTTFKILLASWAFYTILKGFRSFNAKNLGSLGQRTAKLPAIKL